MECEFWKDVAAKLHDLDQCNWATHTLSSGLLKEALHCLSEDEIIQGVIFSYRDWSAQPYCDLILAQFSPDKVLAAFLSIKNPEANMKLGVLGFMEDTNRENAIKLASMLNVLNESPDVLNAVRYSLRDD